MDSSPDARTGSDLVHARHLLERSGALLDVADLRDAKRLAQMIREIPESSQLREVIPAARTVYLQGPEQALTSVLHQLECMPVATAASQPMRRIEIPVRYDGVDLETVAERAGLTVKEVTELHAGEEYEVAFFGFAPGQAFFGELPAALRVPRRAVPRTRVPSGALAIANEFSVIYPDASPGGWNLIGTRVGPPTWDVTKEPPSRVAVGDRVRFRPVT